MGRWLAGSRCVRGRAASLVRVAALVTLLGGLAAGEVCAQRWRAAGLAAHAAAYAAESPAAASSPAVCSQEWLARLYGLRPQAGSRRPIELGVGSGGRYPAPSGLRLDHAASRPTLWQPPVGAAERAFLTSGGPGVVPQRAAVHGPAVVPRGAAFGGPAVVPQRAPADRRPAGLLSVPPPNDPYFRSYQTHSLKAIGALDAWETSYGGDDVVVAVISSGVDYDHPDLAANIWRNADEVGGNGVDDDGNGYVDDTIGWNFAEANADPADFPAGLRGTMLAGIIAAETNNGRGVAGTSWFARIMPLKVLRPYPWPGGGTAVGGQDRDLIGAVCYAANNGAGVILIAPILARPEGAAATIDALRAAIEYATVERGALVVAPAGDCGGDPWADDRLWCPDPDRYGVDGENPEILPAALENVVGVQSVGIGNALRTTASWGPWVDLAAPGEEFMTTGVDGQYEYISGARPAVSDFAAAHVAGVVAVMRSVSPDLSPYRMLRSMCGHATKVGPDYEPALLGEWTRNDRYGCGVVHFERTIENLAVRIHDVVPAELVVLTDGGRDWLRHDFRNRYVNRGKWLLTPESQASWLVGEPVRELRAGDPSIVKLTTDVALLRQQRGGEIAGRTFTETLLACPADGPSRNDPASCQRIPYTLRVVPRLWSVHLPHVERASQR